MAWSLGLRLGFRSGSGIGFLDELDLGGLAVSTGHTVGYAGLLMFGKRDAVKEHCTNFWVDYLEIPGTSYTDAAVRFSYRMPELENLWECYRALIQRLRLHVDAAPFTAGPDGFAPDDESQLYALREGLVNLESHSDFFAPRNPTIRVYDNRIEFQNPGRFISNPAFYQEMYEKYKEYCE